MNNIKYVIWDFNGTILDDLDLCIDLLNDMLSNQGKKKVSKKTYLDIFGFPIKDYYIKAGLNFDKQSFDELSVEFIKNYQPRSMFDELHEGVLETLSSLKNKGIKNIILSASQTDNLIEQTNHFGLSSYFDYIVGTDNIKGLGKIDAGLNLINSLKEEKTAFIYVGDTIHDYEVAKALGIDVVLYTKGHQSESRLKLKTEAIIHNISDIMDYIE